MKNRLWTKNFTIITVGSAISMFGDCLVYYALGFTILERTGSSFLYSLFFVVVMLPMLFMPMLAGPYLDRFSRRKAIYTLDYVSSALFFIAAIVASSGFFNYIFYLIIGVFAGSVMAVYMVAYDSFYPMLISEGNYSKAYSVSSLLYPLANTIMAPVSAVAYQSLGLFPIFLIDAFSFLIAASIETQIKQEETQLMRNMSSTFNFKTELKEGIDYLKNNAGLKAITGYFMLTMFVFGGVDMMMLPFFKSRCDLGVTKYAFVMSLETLGRISGGIFHYKYIFKQDRKYRIALFVYIVLTLMDVVVFFSPYYVMVVLLFVVGMLGVTSYNIRTSATQSYVPNDKRGRFNSIFLVMTTAGQVLGQLSGGLLAEFFSIPYIVIGFCIINLFAVYYFIIRNSEDVKFIYNRQV